MRIELRTSWDTLADLFHTLYEAEAKARELADERWGKDTYHYQKWDNAVTTSIRYQHDFSEDHITIGVISE